MNISTSIQIDTTIKKDLHHHRNHEKRAGKRQKMEEQPISPTIVAQR